MHVATNLSEIGFHLSPALLRSEIRFLVPHTQPPFPCEIVPVHLYCLQRVRINEMEIHQVALRPSPPVSCAHFPKQMSRHLPSLFSRLCYSIIALPKTVSPS